MKLLKSLRRCLVRISEILNRGEDFRVYRHEFRSGGKRMSQLPYLNRQRILLVASRSFIIRNLNFDRVGPFVFLANLPLE
jgi:hypothetical protein